MVTAHGGCGETGPGGGPGGRPRRRGGGRAGAPPGAQPPAARGRGGPRLPVRAWGCPGYTPPHPPVAAVAPPHLHEKRAAEELHAALADVPAGVEVHARTVEGPAREVLVDASHTADLLVVGARRHEGRLSPHLGRVTHTALHRSACPVAVVPHGEEGD
ncbi:universal stress protein [Streptomyces albogriseolus]|uniref:universal stress protein n=1 Tax=Streptomyces albogriseolus TaxID=1887 RepID=UPI0036CAC984